MTVESVNDFLREVDCSYDGERYSVRDNGSVFRHPRSEKRPRPNDNRWTFGKLNEQNGYLHIAQVRIHRIVATAFHGDAPSPEHIVDHIDTNRQNNRPSNLRWLTRLENALCNPITRQRIEYLCGSIEAFLEDPSKLRHSKLSHNLRWMRAVTPTEAKACLERMRTWANNSHATSSGGSLGEWIFKPISFDAASSVHEEEGKSVSNLSVFNEANDFNRSKTSGAVQRNWRVPTEFPSCPKKIEENPISAYLANLSEDCTFSRNHLSLHTVLEYAVIDEGKSICIMCESDGMKPWSLAKVTFERDLYVHESIDTYFSREGAQKQFCLAQGKEWTGGDSIDDYC
jgi:hypothetical protein